MSSRKLYFVIGVFVLPILFGVIAFVVGKNLRGDKDKDIDIDTKPSSEESWTVSRVQTPEARKEFAQKWENYLASKPLDIDDALGYVSGEGARFKSDYEIMRVKDETLFGEDLNYYLAFFSFDTYSASTALTHTDIDPMLYKIISDSLILQKAQALGLVNLDNDVFDSIKKDYAKRNLLITQYFDKAIEEYVKTAEGEAIFIWYRNSVVPVDVKIGKEVARRKIDELYTRLQVGQISMKEAADIISSDQEILTKADPTAAANAYYSFRAQKGSLMPVFDDPDLENQLWSLSEGQLSEVLIGKIPYTKQEFESLYDVVPAQDYEDIRDLYYCIIKLNKLSNGTLYVNQQDFEENAPKNSIQEGETELFIK